MFHNFFSILSILILFILTDSGAQNQIISGSVKDSSTKEPVIAASVRVQGSTVVVLTSQDGTFNITIPPNATLVINATGYKELVAETGSLSNFDLLLTEDAGKLEEVVVTGLSTSLKRRNLANAVVTIHPKELIGIAPAQTLDAALSGKITGAYINANTGAPGGGVSIKLRGITSVYGNTQPLFVVDGVYVDNTATSSGINFATGAVAGAVTSNQDNASNRIADLRPEDIESVEILKGASAAAVYGSRAAAGVVVINTKRGRPGKTKITLSQDVGFVTARRLLGVRSFDADKAASLSSDSSRSESLRQQFIKAQSEGKIYDYEKEVYGNTGLTRNTVLSISGGNEKTGIYFSVGHKKEDGIVKNTAYQNNSIRLNVNHELSDRIRIGLNNNFINTSSDRGLSNNDNTGISLGNSLAYTPGFVDLHQDQYGNYPSNPFASSNPLQTIALMRNNEAVNRFISGITIEGTLQTNAKTTTKIIGRGGFDFYHLETTVLFPSELQFQKVNKGTSIQGSTRNINTNYTISVVNTTTPNDDIAFTSSGGVTFETGDYNNTIDAATQVISGQSNINQAGALTGYQFRNKFYNNGFFLQEEALLFDALTLTGGIRLDRSSNNGDAQKYYAYPKGGIAWSITRTGIIRSSFIEDIKLRAAYGQANNIPAYGSKFTSLVVSNINGLSGSVVNTQAGNSKILPERQTEFESGIDVSLLRGKLNLQLTYYDKHIYDFLLLSNPPASSGFATAWKNAGNLRNRGVEISLLTSPVSHKNFHWTSGINFWLNRSKVTKLTTPPVPQGAFGYLGGSFQIEEGKSATQIVGLNGAGVGKVGDAEPIFQANTINEFTFWERLSLKFLLHWKQGGQNINFTKLTSDLGGTTADYDEISNSAGIPNGKYRISKLGVTSEEFVKNSGYVKLREIALYYTFNHLSYKYLKAIKIGFSLNNYFTFTDYDSYDPEVSNFGSGFSTGVELMPYPSSKRAQFHFSVEF